MSSSYIDPTKTWGFEVIRAIDENDVPRVLKAFKQPGSWVRTETTSRCHASKLCAHAQLTALCSGAHQIDAQVEESYGWYKWTPWLHKYHGDTAVHLAIKLERPDILRALLTLHPRLDIRNVRVTGGRAISLSLQVELTQLTCLSCLAVPHRMFCAE